ncbi:hypothetical protein TVAG_189630 [Trichomonas vaginalis G3]|uniref:Uncharacterized protein n=1 Tax=Trichomonas vaginalis (strain ATCC PRA-98 / G3) TaxID=412133 RepID=A2F1R7_TRIV3|nr:glycoprotein 38 family [Trichomonas vaginalis G3]EAY01177.1 hypothetical protein TVAG_189630 [Trichomonas vaginalis G3]KAI5547205.1 glycoprotein 38 family [Trichomonas vaginalis G3]|eukprot:XP_001330124.1 hypothetical protein [Trichomonas vaginalis G3]
MNTTNIRVNLKLDYNYRSNYTIKYVVSTSKVSARSSFTKLQEKATETEQQLDISHDSKPGHYYIGIKLEFENDENQEPFVSKEIDFEKSLSALSIGRRTLTDGGYSAKQGYTVILQPMAENSNTHVYAKFGNNQFTFFKNNTIGINFNESGVIYVNGSANINCIVMSISSIKNDDSVIMIGNGEFSAGNMENVDFNMESAKNYLFVLSSFDGKGQSSLDGDIDEDALELVRYNADGTKIVNSQPSRKLLAGSSQPDNIDIYSMKNYNDEYKFSYNFKTTNSNDKERIIINSKFGTHNMASEPDAVKVQESSPTPGNKGGNTALIAAVVAVIVIIVIVCVIVFFVMKKKKQAKRNDSEEGDVHEDESFDRANAV